jgi:TonB-linked SusC/RagA family outer membrane protein
MRKNSFIRKLIFILPLFLSSLIVFGQNIEVRGIVTDSETGEALIGVSVVQKGTQNGVLTDIDGRYSLSVPPGTAIQFSYVGYVNQELAANSPTIDVALQSSQQMLDELIVVGYGVQKKSVVTAAISKVTSEDLNDVAPTRIEDVLKGKVSGVQITKSSGQPGSDSKIRIRGIGSVNNSDPLYIVDGMPVGGGIDNLNPSDIASVEILKDAASAAIYGTNGANGVVLVTTKNGSAGKATINYDVSYGWQNPWKIKTVLNAQEYMVIMNEAQVNDGNNPRYTYEQIAGAGKGTNWQKETFNFDAPITNHQVSIGGGNDKGSYFLSLGYLDQEGIIGGNVGKSNYERWSLRSNSTYDIYDKSNERSFLNKLKIGLNIGYSRTTSTSIETNSEYGSVLGSALTFNPLVPVYAPETSDNSDIWTVSRILERYPDAVTDKDGKVFSIPPAGFQEIANPVALLYQPRSEKGNSDKIIGSFFGELDLIPHLKFRSVYGVDLAFWGNDGYEFPYFLATQGKSVSQSSVWSEMNRGFTWNLENYLTYQNTFAEVHYLTVVLGQSAQEYKYRQLGGSDYDLLENAPDKANINYATAPPEDERVYGGTGGYDHTAQASYFGRISYNYAERYMLQLTYRRDGSWLFGPNKKWGDFPGVSLGWNVLREPWLKAPDWFDALKIRASWGRNGNAQSINNFAYTSLMDGGQNYYFGGGYSVDGKSNSGTMIYGTSAGRMANPNLHWEQSEQTDIGFDALLLHNRLNFSVDWYNKKTIDMLAINETVPDYVGQSAPWANLGSMKNWGLDWEIGWKHKIAGFNYYINANATYMNNKLIDLGTVTGEVIYESAGASGVGDFVKGENGEVWPYFFGYKTNGIFQNESEVEAYKTLQPAAKPGDVRFVDINNDGILDANDRTKIGKPMPDWTFGLTLGGEYNGIDAHLFFQGTYGNDIFDFSQRGDIPMMNRPEWILARWHGEGTSNLLPRMTSANPNGNWRSSDLYIKDGSYVRLKSAQLGYTLPKNLMNKIVQKLRIYIAAENLLTFTQYNGYDPEVVSGGYTTLGIDRGVYPQSRTVSVGANITF